MVSRRDLTRLPCYACLGVLVLMSLFMFCTGYDNFTTELVPIYLTEAILFIAVDVVLTKKQSQGWVVFLMALVWLLNQAIVWGSPDNLSVILWILFLGQAGLAYALTTKRSVELLSPPNPSASNWGYGASAVIFIYALGKLILTVMYGWAPMHWTSWAVAVLVTSIGYLYPKSEYSGYLKIIGVLIGVITALTISGPGLTILG